MDDILAYLDSQLGDAKGDPHFQLQVSAWILKRCRDEIAYRRNAMSTFSKVFNPKKIQFPLNAPIWDTSTATQSQSPDGYVYFLIEEGDGRFTKIGRAQNIGERLTDVQTGNPRLLRVARRVPGGDKLEKWLHGKFAQSQIRSEWFYTHEEMATVQPPSDL